LVPINPDDFDLLGFKLGPYLFYWQMFTYGLFGIVLFVWNIFNFRSVGKIFVKMT
jgi:hypothetical protein